MKVMVKKKFYLTIKEEEVEYCCKDLSIGNARVKAEQMKNGSWEKGVFLPFQGGANGTNYVHANYCPFCGEKIEVVEEE